MVHGGEGHGRDAQPTSVEVTGDVKKRRRPGEDSRVRRRLLEAHDDSEIVLDRILLELSTNEEPMWTYFDSQHKLIMTHMKETFEISVDTIKGEFVSITVCHAKAICYRYPL